MFGRKKAQDVAKEESNIFDDNLGPELKLHVFSFLATPDALQMLKVNRANHAFNFDGAFWKQRLAKDFGKRADEASAKQVYLQNIPTEKNLVLVSALVVSNMVAKIEQLKQAQNEEQCQKLSQEMYEYLDQIERAVLLMGRESCMPLMLRMLDKYYDEGIAISLNRIFQLLFVGHDAMPGLTLFAGHVTRTTFDFSEPDDALDALISNLLFKEPRYLPDRLKNEVDAVQFLLRTIGKYAATGLLENFLAKLSDDRKQLFIKKFGTTLFANCVPVCNLEFVKALIHHGLDVNAGWVIGQGDRSIEAPLLTLVLQKVRVMLLERDTEDNIELQDKLKNFHTMLEFLLERGADPDQQVLCTAHAVNMVFNVNDARELAQQMFLEMEQYPFANSKEAQTLLGMINLIKSAPRLDESVRYKP